MKKEIVVLFEKIDLQGISIGKYHKKNVLTYGVLPGEEAKILVKRERKNFIEGELIEIIKPSKFRIKEKESHYLSCSPWQTFNYDYQINLKKEILKKIFLELAGVEIELENFFASPKIFEYRNKIEYSFLKEGEKLYYSFYKRGSFKEKIKLENGCLLINRNANKIAFELLIDLENKNIKDLKTLIIRKSQNYPDIHFSLLTTNESQSFNFEHKDLSGFAFIYSRKESPASVFDKIINEWGKEYLREKVLDLEIKYHYSSFFQNNIYLFEKALKIMRENSESFKKVVDLYCGVGIIGLSLKKFGKEIIGVETDKMATKYAEINAKLNNVENFKIITSLAEKIPKEILENTDLLILDPPRVGLHKKLINLILATKPKNIFYLSCNPNTQARDFNLLKDSYQIKKVYGFDFYPNTPHLESLLILKLK